MNSIQPPSLTAPSSSSKIPSNYQNLSQIAKASGKLLGNWIQRKIGKDEIAQFKQNHPEIEQHIIVIKGRVADQGTYAHPLLAARFAAWCNFDFVEHVVSDNIRMRECMKALQAKNEGNVYQLEATKDFDERLQYLIDAGYWDNPQVRDALMRLGGILN